MLKIFDVKCTFFTTTRKLGGDILFINYCNILKKDAFWSFWKPFFHRVFVIDVDFLPCMLCICCFDERRKTETSPKLREPMRAGRRVLGERDCAEFAALPRADCGFVRASSQFGQAKSCE